MEIKKLKKQNYFLSLCFLSIRIRDEIKNVKIKSFLHSTKKEIRKPSKNEAVKCYHYMVTEEKDENCNCMNPPRLCFLQVIFTQVDTQSKRQVQPYTYLFSKLLPT